MDTFESQPGSWRIHFGKWEILGLFVSLLLISAVITIFLSRSQPVNIFNYLFIVVVSICFAGAYYLARALLIQPFSDRTKSVWLRLLVHLGGVVLAVLIGGEIAARIISLPGGMTVEESRLKFMPVGLALLLIALIIEEGFDALKRHIRRVERREAQVRHQALGAELSALQARTNPHFLFNSLNTVAGLIRQDPARAEVAITRLVGLMRYTLKSGEASMVRLADEVRAAEMYLEVEKTRFGDRLRSEIQVEPGLENLAVPPLILQPLVENAVLHGIAPRREGGTVAVSVRKNRSSLCYTVEDDGPGPGGSTQKGTGTALADMSERLEILYGDQATLTTGTGEKGGYSIRVVMPTSISPLAVSSEARK
jgi:two-component system sensor histidine kinase AlgZ